MFKALFNIIISLLATIVQIVTSPLNAGIKAAFPDLSAKVIEVTNALANMFNGMSWALGLVPDVIIGTLLFIVTLEIAKHSVYVMTHVLIQVWNLFQKLKFW